MKLIRLLTVLAIVLGFTAQAYAELPTGMSERSARKISRAKKGPKNPAVKPLNTYCKSTTPLSKALLKNAYPGHINASDPRAPGFAFVCGPDCPSGFPVSAYYSDGTPAFKLGYYGRWEGNNRPRAYCGAGGVAMCNVKTVSSGARQKGRDGKIYLVFNSKSKSCRSASPGQRNGSPF